MLHAVPLLAQLVVALVLMAAAIGKLHTPARAGALESLRLPRAVLHPGLLKAHPWMELGLALILLLAPGLLGVVARIAAFALLAVYLLLVTRALRGPTPVDCDCFGAWGASRVTSITVARNAWLLALAAAALAPRDDTLLAFVWSGEGPMTLLAVAVGAVTTALVMANERAAATAVVGPAPASPSGAPEADYVRTRTPSVPVTLGNGETETLRSLSAERPQVLLFVSETCGSCENTLAATPGYRDRLPEVDVRILVEAAPDRSTLTNSQHPATVHDPDRNVRASLGFEATPSAVLLGADGLLAGGPVRGWEAINAFMDEIDSALHHDVDAPTNAT